MQYAPQQPQYTTQQPQQQSQLQQQSSRNEKARKIDVFFVVIDDRLHRATSVRGAAANAGICHRNAFVCDVFPTNMFLAAVLSLSLAIDGLYECRGRLHTRAR
jgi:hypothetical protein